MTLLMFTQMRFRTFANERNKQPSKKRIFTNFLFCKKEYKIFCYFSYTTNRPKVFYESFVWKEKSFLLPYLFWVCDKIGFTWQCCYRKREKENIPDIIKPRNTGISGWCFYHVLSINLHHSISKHVFLLLCTQMLTW